VQATLNDAPVGRNVDETLRLVQAFQYVDEHGEVCPVNWTVRCFLSLCFIAHQYPNLDPHPPSSPVPPP
jgi:alkyl hydroperoxide reductase subunit AhpC